MLKIYHPEDNQSGFMMLREAYEEALRLADSINNRLQNNATDNNLNNTHDTGESIKEADLEASINPEFQRITPNYETVIENNFGKLYSIYNDIFSRRDIECWRKLFLYLSIDEYQRLCRYAYVFFNKNYHLTHEIWKLINQELLLCENRQFLWHDLVQYDYGLSLDSFQHGETIDFEEYLDKRFSALTAFRQEEYETAARLSEEAEKMHNNDPVLYRIKGMSYYMLKDNTKAMEAFTRVLELDSDDLDSLLFRGKILLAGSRFREAQKDFRRVLEIDPYCTQAYKGIINALYGLKKYSQASRLVKNQMSKNPEDFEIDLMYSKISDRRKIIKTLKLVIDKYNYISDKYSPLKIIIALTIIPAILIFLLINFAQFVVIPIFILMIVYIFFPSRRR